MPKYHINPVTGDPRPCNAVKRPCKYAKAGELHFESKEDARRAFEQKMSTPEGWLENKKLAGITDCPRDTWRYYDDMEVHSLPNGEILAVEKQHSFWKSGPESSEIWLVDSSGEAVGFAKVIDHSERDEYQLVLADIEIRPEYRGQKKSHQLMKHIEDHFGKPCYTTGGYTPEGYAALNSFMAERTLPMEYNGRVEPKVDFRSMNFVKDWNFLIPEH